MTAPPRSWRAARSVEGPEAATHADIPALNEVFAEAFTDRYRRDGMSGVRVPPLNPAIWRYAIDDAGAGAHVWRDRGGRIVAFNMVHRSGVEGWMGPLCVRPEQQGGGLGKRVVEAGISWLRREGARVIGLETMPRTMDNIGFYSALGFQPGPLTVTLTLDAHAADVSATRLGTLDDTAREAAIAGCRVLSDRLAPGYDFTRELQLTHLLGLGDTILLGADGAPTGFACFHEVPLVEGRPRDELRVLKLVLARRSDLPTLLRALGAHAHERGIRRVALRVQGNYTDAYRLCIALGARVRWTDLRMTVHGWDEHPPREGMLLSNWEI